jgi:hypothetical protein
MSEDMSTNRLATIRASKKCICTGVALDLVCLEQDQRSGHKNQSNIKGSTHHQDADIELCNEKTNQLKFHLSTKPQNPKTNEQNHQFQLTSCHAMQTSPSAI